MNSKAIVTLLTAWEEKRGSVSVEEFAKQSAKKKEKPAEPKEKKPPSEYQNFLKKWREENPTVKGKEAIKQGAAAWNSRAK